MSEPRHGQSAPIGPGSIVWETFGDSRHYLTVGAAGVLQNMHPAVGSVLQQHSNFFEDPLDRLIRSAPQIGAVVYDEQADEWGTRVRDFHKKMRATDSLGRSWAALNPEVYLWTHATFVWMVDQVHERFGTPLTDAEHDQLIRESLTWWRRYGMRDLDQYWADWSDYRAYWDRITGELLEANPTTDFAFAQPDNPLPAPAGIPELAWKLTGSGVMRSGMWLTTGMLPPAAREILGLRWRRADEFALRRFGDAVRIAWAVLPEEIRWTPWALSGRIREGQSRPRRFPSLARRADPNS